MDQADRLRAMASIESGSHKTRIMSVTSGKGGVGKTNIAVNLSIAFSRRGLKVLLIDADLGLANANLVLGCPVASTFDDVMFSNADIREVFIRTPYEFDLLPGSSGVRQMLELDAFSQRAIFDRLGEVIHAYDIVIYDTAPGIGSHVLNFNSFAHEIVVVAHPEPTALADAYALIKVLATERREKHFRLLVNRAVSTHDGIEAFKRITSVSEEFLNISIDYLGSLPEDASVLKAVQCQRPVLESHPRASFSISLERLCDKLLASQNRNLTKKLWNTELMPATQGGTAV